MRGGKGVTGGRNNKAAKVQLNMLSDISQPTAPACICEDPGLVFLNVVLQICVKLG